MKVKVKLSLAYAGPGREDFIEIDDSEIKGLSPDEIEQVVTERATEWAMTYLNLSWEISEGPGK